MWPAQKRSAAPSTLEQTPQACATGIRSAHQMLLLRLTARASGASSPTAVRTLQCWPSGHLVPASSCDSWSATTGQPPRSPESSAPHRMRPSDFCAKPDHSVSPLGVSRFTWGRSKPGPQHSLRLLTELWPLPGRRDYGTGAQRGRGIPVGYQEPVPELAAFAAALNGAIRTAARTGVVDGVHLVLEPGRAVVAEAGVLRASVLRVSLRPGIDHRRWVYLDVGRYSGLAEAEGEAITYRLRVPARDGAHGPVVLAGPSCDGDDVLYRDTPYTLPLSLRAGDAIDLLAAGAYTASYSSVGFNGIPPLSVRVLSLPRTV